MLVLIPSWTGQLLKSCDNTIRADCLAMTSVVDQYGLSLSDPVTSVVGFCVIPNNRQFVGIFTVSGCG